METYIAYFDESGDDGVSTSSSDFFVLTSIYMNADAWKKNYDKILECRRSMKEKYGFHVSEELHTKHLLSNKDTYRKYVWTDEQRKEIVKDATVCVSSLDAKIINVIIDKTKFVNGNYHVLQNALNIISRG